MHSSEISVQLKIKYQTVCSTLRRKNNIKKKTRPKKNYAKSFRLIQRNVNKIIEYNDKLTARKVISIWNLKVSRRSMQRELHDNDYAYGISTKKICSSEVDKISRVEICKTWLKTMVDFAKVVMTDEKLFRLDGPNNWFSFHGCLLYTSPSPRD